MGVNAVDGYGQITKSNAKDIYTAWKRGEVDLTVSQQKYAESFLSPSDFDDISYDTTSSYEEGYSQINTDGTDKGQGLNGTLTTVGSGAALLGTYIKGVGPVAPPAPTAAPAPAPASGTPAPAPETSAPAPETSAPAPEGGGGGGAETGSPENVGDAADKSADASEKTDKVPVACLIGGAIAVASAAISCVSAAKFDSALSERKSASDASSATNATLDGYSDSLVQTMDMMNEDMVVYEEQQGELAMATNENTSQMASLQVELADATAAGDKNAIKEINAKIKELQGADMSGYTEELEETESKLDEYQAANSESSGVKDAGQSVSNFLKEGTGMGVLGVIQTVLLGVAAVKMTKSALSAISAASPYFSNPFTSALGATLTAAAVMFTAGAAGQIAATVIMGVKTAQEFECGSNGSDMQDHVDSLGEMMTEQSDYIGQTDESFQASAEEAQETMDKGQEAADKAVAKNTGGSTGGGNPFASGGSSGGSTGGSTTT